MADKRMFANQIIDSDSFLEMPLSSQALYFHLSMKADDEGFVNNPNSILRKINATKDDMNILIFRRFIIDFESGVIVIKHWKIHNWIRQDRLKGTTYKEERALLDVKENQSYTLKNDGVRQVSDKRQSDVSVEEIKLDKSSINNSILASTDKTVTAEKGENSIIKLPLNDNTEYPLSEKLYQEYVTLYPAVDVLQALNKMRAWLISNPKQRKTKSGILRFINTWLSKEQDRGGKKEEKKEDKEDYSYYVRN